MTIVEVGQAFGLPVGLIAIAGQHAFESKRKHKEQRAIAYSDYLTALTEQSRGVMLTEDEHKKQIQRVVAARYRICVYGSARVIRAMVDGSKTPDLFDNFESQRSLAVLVEEMRRDVGAKHSTIIDLHQLLFLRNTVPNPE